MDAGLSSVASLGLYLATRTAPAGHGRAVRDVERLVEALDRGALTVDDTVRIADVTTTVGRHLVAACLPPSFRAVVATPWDADRGAREVIRIVHELHVEIAGRCVDALEMLGRRVAERSGLSLALDDFLPPAALRELLDEARRASAAIEDEYSEGLITDGERYNRQVDVWSRAADAALRSAREYAPVCDPLAACAASQRAPVRPEVLRSPRCLIAPRGYETTTHLTGTFGAGIGPHEYFLRSAEARRATTGEVDRRQQAIAMFAELDVVIGDVEIVEIDCGTRRGVTVRAIVFEEDERGPLAAKITGAVTAEDVRDRRGGVIAAAGSLLVPELVRRIEAAQIPSVMLRDVRTCEASGGVCARCFGLDPEDGLWTCVGDPVGARAAQTIAFEASRLPPRRIYHIC